MKYLGEYVTDTGITVYITAAGIEFYKLSTGIDGVLQRSWTLTLNELKDAIASGRLTKVAS